MSYNNYMGKIDEDFSGTTIPNYDSAKKTNMKTLFAQKNIKVKMKEDTRPFVNSNIALDVTIEITDMGGRPLYISHFNEINSKSKITLPIKVKN